MVCPMTMKSMQSMKFQGSENYVATPDLMLAVNAAIQLQRPLLVKGEPGTGKTMLAEEAAQALGMPLLQWHIKSTTKAQQGLYEYDAVNRLRDSQLGDARARSHGVLLLRDAPAHPRQAPPAGVHHLQQRKRTARRLSAPLLLPLHQVPRGGHHAPDRGCAFPGPQRRAARCRHARVLRNPQTARPKEKTLHQRAGGLAQALAGRRNPPRSPAQRRAKNQRPPAGGCSVEERTGHLPV